ncbi:MAG: hypothetical protein EXR77_18410 [Myxococcales bacterium]|nr:hypothetical protein [Myxococcales bacterium]
MLDVNGLLKLLARRLALAVFTDGFWGAWSLSTMPADHLKGLLSFNAVTYDGTDTLDKLPQVWRLRLQ